MITSRTVVLAVLFLVLGSWFSVSEAAPPQVINYQGRLINGTNLVNGTIGLTLSIYGAETGGTLLCADSNQVTVVDGLYSTFIGDGLISGSLANLAGNSSLYVEVIIDGFTFSPRERMGWVVRSLDADTLDGIDSSAFATGTPLYVFDEIDPLWNSEKAGYATGTPLYAESDPIWNAQKSGYATGTPLYTFAEADPVWTAVSNSVQSQIDGKVFKTGDTMTGMLIVSNSLAQGRYTIAEGLNSHAEGDSTVAFEYASHAEGYMTTSHGAGSHTEGRQTITSKDFAHAEGDNTRAEGWASHAEGNAAVTTNTYAHAEGMNTVAGGDASHAEGENAQASGARSHAEGRYAAAYGARSHAEGDGTMAFGESSHAEGLLTKSYGAGSHAEGSQTITSNVFAHAEGLETRAEGYGSHAEGERSLAGGRISHAEGYRSQAIHSNTFVWADGTDADFASITNDEFAIRAAKGIRLVGGPFIGDGSGLINVTADSYAETDPVWNAQKSGYATGTPLYVFTETDPLWTAQKSGYATGTPVYTEVDPVWTAASNSVQSQINGKVSKSGDTMTGDLDMGNHSITNVNTNTIVFTDGSHAVRSAGDTISDLTVTGTLSAARISGEGSVPPGCLMPYAGTSAPAGWLLCDGAAVSRTTYAGLFGVISTTFGTGDGSTTFNLPDLRGQIPLGKDDMGGSSAGRVTDPEADRMGGSGGEESHTLDINEMPAHSHFYNEAFVVGTSVSGDDMPASYSGVSFTAPQGNDQPHNNMQPYLTLNYIIKQ